MLVFAGAQLALTIMDLQQRKDYFVAVLMLGITLASNLAVGFIVGIVVAPSSPMGKTLSLTRFSRGEGILALVIVR